MFSRQNIANKDKETINITSQAVTNSNTVSCIKEADVL